MFYLQKYFNPDMDHVIGQMYLLFPKNDQVKFI